MSGTILPVYRWQVNYNGSPAAGAKAYFYLSGTNTPHDTYNNADLDPSHKNTNPVVADADGVLPIIYLDAVAYRVLITTSTGTTIFAAQDNIFDLFQVFQATTETANTVYAGPSSGSPAAPTFRALVAADLPSSGAITLANNGLNDFRLSLTTAVPVTTADVTAATTIYAVPYGGNRIALYDASGVPTFYTSNQFSIAVPATTNTMYDIFCYASAGVPVLELTAWASDTSRTTGIVANVASGVYTKSGDATRRYLGSFRTTGSSGQTEDSFAKRYLWNYYNRAMRPGRVTEATNSWTSTTATPHQANGVATNQLDFVIGVAEVALTIDVYAAAANTDATAGAIRTGVGEDSTTVYSTVSTFLPANMASNTALTICPLGAHLQKFPAVGRHFYAWLVQAGGSGTTTFYGDGGGTDLNQGIFGWIMG